MSRRSKIPRTESNPCLDGWLQAVGAIGAVGGALIATTKMLQSAGQTIGSGGRNSGGGGLPTYVRDQLLSPIDMNTTTTGSKFTMKGLLDLQSKFKKKGTDAYNNSNYPLVNECLKIQQVLASVIESRERLEAIQREGDMTGSVKLSAVVEKLQRQLADLLTEADDIDRENEEGDIFDDDEGNDEAESSQDSFFQVLKRTVGFNDNNKDASLQRSGKRKQERSTRRTGKLKREQYLSHRTPVESPSANARKPRGQERNRRACRESKPRSIMNIGSVSGKDYDKDNSEDHGIKDSKSYQSDESHDTKEEDNENIVTPDARTRKRSTVVDTLEYHNAGRSIDEQCVSDEESDESPCANATKTRSRKRDLEEDNEEGENFSQDDSHSVTKKRKTAKPISKRKVIRDPVWSGSEENKLKEGEFITDARGDTYYFTCDGEKVGEVALKILRNAAHYQNVLRDEVDEQTMVEEVIGDLMECNALKFDRRSLKDPQGELVPGMLLVVPPSCWHLEDEDDNDIVTSDCELMEEGEDRTSPEQREIEDLVEAAVDTTAEEIGEKE